MSTSLPDVLVVGAGPVGLTMAAELGRHGVACRIIDQLAIPLPYCWTIGVTPRTLEVTAASSKLPTLIDVPISIDTAGQFNYLSLPRIDPFQFLERFIYRHPPKK